MKPGESPEAAIVRELQEEIGMTACAALERLQAAHLEADQKIFLVRDVEYDAEPSLEIRQVREFGFGDFPRDLNPRSWRRLLAAAQSQAQGTKVH